MNRRTQVMTCGLVIGTLAGVLSACGNPGDLTITNESVGEVTVEIDDDVTEVSAGGGVVLLDAGCTTGDIVIGYSSGRTLVVPGPICPEQEIVIRNDTVDIRP